MSQYTVGTPEGTRDRLYSECRDRRALENSLLELFDRRGYSEVITPTVEYYDMFVKHGNSLPQESMLKMVDRSGRILVLRPDMTTPIARVAATKLKNEVLPQRFCYLQSVYRSDTMNAGKNSEIAQAGIEIIGAGGMKADIEVISMAADALKTCGLDEFYMGLGHAGIFKALVDELNTDADTVEEIHRLIEIGNYAALDDLLEPYKENPACLAIKKLPSLFGGEEVFAEAQGYIEGVRGAADALKYLREVFGALKAAGYHQIGIDLSIVNKLDYYTGVIFHGYVEGAGSAVLSGGRYDALIQTFGTDMPANGFAVDIDAIAASLPTSHRSSRTKLIHFDPAHICVAYAYIDSQPAGSCELSPGECVEQSAALARSKGIECLVVISDEVSIVEVPHE